MVVRGPNSENLSLFTGLSLMWSLVSVPLLFSSVSLKMGKNPSCASEVFRLLSKCFLGA